jgi:hypothetical protein
MSNWLKNGISNLRAKQITLTKIREAYIIQDSKFLVKAYKYGSNHLKRIAVGYISEITEQTNYNFLVKEMKLVKDEKLKSYIYVSIMKLSLSESIEVTDEELKYLNQNLALLNNIGYVTGKSAQKTKTTFINRSRDYIGMLEQMKKDFEIY